MGNLAICSLLAVLTFSTAAAADDTTQAAPHTIAFPSGAAGFTFGATKATVLKMRGCLPDTDPTRAACDLNDDVLGFPARASLGFCSGKLCMVGVTRMRDPSMTDDEWIAAVGYLEAKLTAKYGRADQTPSLSDACAKTSGTFLACVRAKSFDPDTWWYWTSPDSHAVSRICFSLSAVSGGPDSLMIMYQSARSLTAVQARHQRQDDAL